MEIKFYNSLTNSMEVFQPQQPGQVRMYSCGPTVYDFAHIGNFRTFLFGDIVQRFLEATGHEVHHIMNITDVGHMTDDDVADGGGEDKMQAAARRIKEDKKSGKVPEGAVENPDDPYQIARYYTDAFVEDSLQLGLKVASNDRQNLYHATDHIPEMIVAIESLVELEHAYVGEDGVVYFSVESFKPYGNLSGNTLDALREGSGGRISAEDQANKRHPGDFMLWKPDPSHIMKWDSPWGAGYPGWHIECSTMAMKRLEMDVIDIHTGGEDLIFPHHECEIAQACGVSGQEYFSRYWMHARFLLVEGEKMSKSKGNFFTVRDVLDGTATGRPVHPSVLRYELIRSHYRANLNFTTKGLQDSANAVRRMIELRERLEEETGGQAAEIDNSHPVVSGFLSALADDMNVSGALGVVLPWISNPSEPAAEALGVLNRINSVLNVAPVDSAPTESASDGGDVDADALCRELDEARAQKNYARADEIRDELVAAGFDVRTSSEGTVAKRKMA